MPKFIHFICGNSRINIDSTQRCKVFSHTIDIAPPNLQNHSTSNYTKTTIYKSIRILILSMKICGMCFERCNISHSSILWKFYSLFIGAILLFNIFRCTITYGIGGIYDEGLFIRLQWLIWSLENLIKLIVFLVIFYKEDRIPALFIMMDKTASLGYSKSVKRFLSIVISLSIIAPLICCFLHLMLHFCSGYVSKLLMDAMWPKYLNKYFANWVEMCFDLFIIYINSSICSSSVGIFVFLCYFVINNMQKLKQNMNEELNTASLHYRNLGKHRQVFQGLCDTIYQLDKCFMHFLLLSLIAEVPLFCVMFYHLIFFAKVSAFIFLSIVINVTMLLYLYTLLFFPAKLNAELLMFVNQLSGPDIGLTACDIIVITRQTLLTVAGMLVTYFILMVQFRDSAETKLSLCMCSNSANPT
uniref:Gustatory receptor n=1 Tax=Octopus bimaculoides TaxID=37653 RepID=A0A0L8FSD6_OCTBM